MSIDLTTLVLTIQDLSQSEKHVLTVLCYLSNKYHEVYRSIEKLSSDCSCSIKTIERTLKSLREKNYLIYTGKLAPKSKNIPIYSIYLNHGQNGGDKHLTTDNLSFKDGQNEGVKSLTTDKMGIRIDNKNKDNNKDILFTSSKNQTINPDAQDKAHDKKMREYEEMIKKRKSTQTPPIKAGD